MTSNESTYGVITADVVNSTALSVQELEILLDRVKYEFDEAKNLTIQAQWVQRGDAFQILTDEPSRSLEVAMFLRSVVNLSIRSANQSISALPKTDLRMAIGLGTVTLHRSEISESTGPAFVRAGRALDKMKATSDRRFKIITGHEDIDKELDLTSHMMSAIFQRWSYASAEVLYWYLKGHQTQHEIATQLGITQSSVQRRMESMSFDVYLHFNQRLTEIIKSLD